MRTEPAGALPESYPVVLVLSETEGLKNAEIAEVLEVSLETVKIRLAPGEGPIERCSWKRIAVSIAIPVNTPALADIKRLPHN